MEKRDKEKDNMKKKARDIEDQRPSNKTSRRLNERNGREKNN